MKRLAPLILVLIASGLPLLLSPNEAAASHPYGKPFLWSDLVSGDGHISYCLKLEGNPGESSWDDGVENWDAALGAPLSPAFDFDPASCNPLPQVQLQWQGGTSAATTPTVIS
jgi:hypothetical protein